MSDLINDKLYQLSEGDIARLNEVLPDNWSKNNPVDIIGDASSERYYKALQVADCFTADIIYVLITPQFMTDPEAICQLLVKHTFKTKVFPVLLGGELMQPARRLLEEKKMHYFESLNEAVSFL